MIFNLIKLTVNINYYWSMKYRLWNRTKIRPDDLFQHREHIIRIWSQRIWKAHQNTNKFLRKLLLQFVGRWTHQCCPDDVLPEYCFQGLLYIFIPQTVDQWIQQCTHKVVEDSYYFRFLNSLVIGCIVVNLQPKYALAMKTQHN